MIECCSYVLQCLSYWHLCPKIFQYLNGQYGWHHPIHGSVTKSAKKRKRKYGTWWWPSTLWMTKLGLCIWQFHSMDFRFGLDLFNNDTCPSGHISCPTQVNVYQSCFNSLSKLLKLNYIVQVWGLVDVDCVISDRRIPLFTGIPLCKSRELSRRGYSMSQLCSIHHSSTVWKQHYFVYKMIYFKLLIAVVVQCWCYLTSALHLTLLIMKNL